MGRVGDLPEVGEGKLKYVEDVGGGTNNSFSCGEALIDKHNGLPADPSSSNNLDSASYMIIRMPCTICFAISIEQLKCRTMKRKNI